MKRYRLPIILMLVLLPSFAWAQVQSPVIVMRDVADRLIAQLEQHQGQLKRQAVIDRIVGEVIIPYVASDVMAGSVAGRRYWLSATPEQRREFVEQFKRLVISTYSAAFSAYDHDKVKFYPLRENYQNAKYLRVRSEIIRRNGQIIPVEYNLLRVSNAWKIYDFSIENVSMVGSYRSQFSGVLSTSGMGGLIVKLKQHNRAS